MSARLGVVTLGPNEWRLTNAPPAVDVVEVFCACDAAEAARRFPACEAGGTHT